jgi:hypothetical protein
MRPTASAEVLLSETIKRKSKQPTHKPWLKLVAAYTSVCAYPLNTFGVAVKGSTPVLTSSVPPGVRLSGDPLPPGPMMLATAGDARSNANAATSVHIDTTLSTLNIIIHSSIL